MKAWAALSAAAVLVALPVSGRAAADVVSTATVTPVAGSGAVPATWSAAELGVVLWLAVAVVAVVAAFLVLRHSRAQAAPASAGPAAGTVTTRSAYVGSPSTVSGR